MSDNTKEVITYIIGAMVIFYCLFIIKGCINEVNTIDKIKAENKIMLEK